MLLKHCLLEQCSGSKKVISSIEQKKMLARAKKILISIALLPVDELAFLLACFLISIPSTYSVFQDSGFVCVYAYHIDMQAFYFELTRAKKKRKKLCRTSYFKQLLGRNCPSICSSNGEIACCPGKRIRQAN